MEDSGVDSGDVQCAVTYTDSTEKSTGNREYTEIPTVEHLPSKPQRQHKSAQQLQKEIEARIEKARWNHSQSTNGSTAIEQQPKKGLIPITRLHVPGKGAQLNLQDGAEQPLVTWIADSSEDEYEFHPGVSPKTFANKEISNQLRKDGFNLDMTPDDEDLDLIPPRPMTQTCACCQWAPSMSSSTCSIQ